MRGELNKRDKQNSKISFQVYNKTQRDKFAWAIAMAEADFSF